MAGERGVFAISVVAEMVEMPAQNLRVYERHGLVDPGRTDGGTRRYSRADIERLHRIRDLLADGPQPRRHRPGAGAGGGGGPAAGGMRAAEGALSVT